ncbi:DinB family protein [Bacillus pumilus]|uniref:DinB family protein n=1 Tax=Bacillus pumilus TaxID=1408 RepID=UPI003338EBB3
MTLNKETVMDHYEHTLEWAQSLTEVTEEEWRSAITDGKWSIAEIIAHFVSWDEFILHDRLKEFWNDRALCKAPDVHEMNRQSAERARHEERSETIGRFIAVRTVASRNEENRSISLDYTLSDRSNRADVIKLF